MKTNMSLFRFSIVDFLLLLLFNTIVFVGLIGGINFLLRQSFFSGPSSSWIVILPFVILHPLLRSIWNRNGILIIEDEQTYLYKSDSITDPYDLVAYTFGGCIYYTVIKIYNSKHIRV